MYICLLGQKIGSTSFYKDNKKHHVTLVSVENNQLIGAKFKDKDGYSSIKVSAFEKKEKNVNKPQVESYKKLGLEKMPAIEKEFKLPKDLIYDKVVSVVLSEDMVGEIVDVTGVSKGKGFAGAMKRHNFAGMPATHGVSLTHRSHGSTGNRTLPGRVFKGKKMAGRMGGCQRTEEALEIMFIDKDLNLIGVKGGIPGPRKSFVSIKSSVKSGSIFNAKVNEK
jgi:large subunit ribosomal protein L3